MDDKLVKLLDEATDLLSSFVVPLFYEKAGRPAQFGSGFFVSAGESHYLVSAAHVLEHAKSLFYYIEPNTTAKLSGECRLNRWSGDRNNDPIDVGVLKLRGSVPPYPKVNKCAVDFSYLLPNMAPRAEKLYSIIGFPASKSKINSVEREVSTTVYAFRNRSIPDSEYKKHGASPTTHIILPLDLRKGFNSNRQQQNFPSPKGMSGSPIFMLMEENSVVNARSFPIIGIGTKYRRATKILVGTDVDIAMRMITEAA